MVRLRDIPRTATFAWSPGTTCPYLATGTKAGAVDADFSNETQLELWNLDLDNFMQNHESQPVASIDTDSRFHDIAWVQSNGTANKGIIAGALENGSLDLWSAERLIDGQGTSFISRTSKHIGAIKAIQFNPFRSELLATAGAKGELFVFDLNNIDNPLRMGNSLARGDDFECLDWNKNVPHIMVTGSNGGFVTVWDVKTKKESLTLNNLGRKAVSAVVWDPTKHTRLITAIPHDTDPLILVWDLRNSNTPERVLRGHDGGVLSLSWCSQDNDLLLSCGKDNRSICWNPQNGEQYGEFPVVTNWTFQTRWNPHNPNLIATASFDGKISVQSIQNAKSDFIKASGSQIHTINDEDFFNKAQQQPQGANFNLQKAPKWMKRPCSASFGFGGKLISFTSAGSLDALRRSTVRISPFIIDARVSRATEAFENAVKNNDLRSICKARISDATFSADKADWKLIETLALENPRKRFVEHLGVSSTVEADADVLPKLPINEENKEILEMPERSHELSLTKPNRLPAFFDSNFKGDDFLSDLAATKGAKTNNPFQIYSSNESEPDRGITHALLLGQFEKALDLCLQEDRLPDAFMIAICGGQDCIDKVQKAYFNKKRAGPNYMRLLASVVGKNLWDVVYNAEIRDWKEVMAILCTYASANEFPDLCEALGDRLEENMTTNDSQSLREEASLCYLAGSKLEKVVPIWISELDENRASNQEDIESSNFSTYVCLLQNFIEKVTVFREVTHFHDNDLFAVSGWKLSALYDKYAEYADIVTSHGQLQIAYKYLTLLPEKYPSAAVSKNRIKEAIHQPALGSTTNKSANSASRTQRSLPNVGNHPSPVKPSALEVPKSYIISSQAPPPNTRSQAANGPYNATVFHSGHVTYDQAYQPQRQPQLPPNMTQPAAYNSNYPNQNAALPQRNFNASPSIPPPSQAQNISNWNDTPESFFKPPTSRRGTPSTGITNAAVPLVYPAAITPNVGTPYGIQPKPAPPLAPPPKGSAIPPPRMSSPSSTISHSYQSSERPSSSAASAYLPQQPNPTSGPVHSVALQQQQGLAHPRVPTQHQGLIPRGPSPYHAPPSTPPVSNRYAPTISTTKVGFGSQSEPSDITGPNQHAPPSQHPYSPQKSYIPHQLNASIQPSGPQMSSSLPPKSFEASTSASRGFAQNSRSVTDQVQPGEIAINPVHVKHPHGDRSHIPAHARPIYEALSSDMQRVKARAPQSFKPQVNDTEKRLNILFDHLNNEDLLELDTVQDMVKLSQALQARNFEQAQAIHVDIMTNKTEECGNWMVGVKRLIGMSRATP